MSAKLISGLLIGIFSFDHCVFAESRWPESYALSRDRMVIELFVTFAVRDRDQLGFVDDKFERQRFCDKIVAESFRAWVFFEGPWAEKNQFSEYNKEYMKVISSIVRRFKSESKIYDDPADVFEILSDMDADEALSDYISHTLFPGFDTRKIKNENDYLDLVEKFHLWVNGEVK